MAKNRNTATAEAQEVSQNDVQDAGTPEASGKAPRGSSLAARVRAAFMEILGEYVSSETVSAGTLDGFKTLYEELPVTGLAGIPYDVQLANIQTTVNDMFTSGNVDQDKLYKLLDRKKRIQRDIKKAAKGTAEVAEVEEEAIPA